jgi:hypothetical protein
MPNHVQNTVTITGPEKDIDALMRLVKSQESVLDFDKIVRSPKVLRSVTVGGSGHVWWVRGDERIEIPKKTIARWRTKYGADNWYDWNVHNWGTKWNAYEVTSERLDSDSLQYVFYTAWSSPKPVMERLAELFPSLRIEVECDGEVDHPFSYTLSARQ